MNTTAACPAFSYAAQTTATVIRNLENAGAILVGKTNMDQFATGLVGTRSPYGACSSVFDDRYISGGSSSGSAVAVAKGLVTFALGTDTAGSGRVPAAFNNLIGLKPTRGSLSTSGVVPACRSLDCVSIFALTSADAWQVFQAARGFDPSDPVLPALCRRRQPGALAWRAVSVWRSPARPVGILRGHRSGAALRSVCPRSGSARRHGRRVRLSAVPRRRRTAVFRPLGGGASGRAAAVFRVTRRGSASRRARHYSQGARNSALWTLFWPSTAWKNCGGRQARSGSSADLLLLPTTGTIYTREEVEADPVRLNTNLGFYTNFVNLLDLAAVAVPAGFRPNGLPFGVSVIGTAQTELALLCVADRLHRALGRRWAAWIRRWWKLPH